MKSLEIQKMSNPKIEDVIKDLTYRDQALNNVNKNTYHTYEYDNAIIEIIKEMKELKYQIVQLDQEINTILNAGEE